MAWTDKTWALALLSAVLLAMFVMMLLASYDAAFQSLWQSPDGALVIIICHVGIRFLDECKSAAS